MKAIAVMQGSGDVRLIDRPEPAISAPDQIKLRVIRVGICGTDREGIARGFVRPPAGQQDLIIGHEMFGQVVEIGPAVTIVRPGDYAVFTVRRGCGQCAPCLMNRSDMCRTGKYMERGIVGMDGFQSEYVVDSEQYIVHVPDILAPVGILCEPLSVCEKALDMATRVQQARLPDVQGTENWLPGRRCLVAGLGPVGLLTAMALRLRGATVYGLDIVDAATPRPQWLQAIGATYINGRQVPARQVGETVGQMDLIVEATGAAGVVFDLIDTLANSGIYVLIGVAGGDNLLPVRASHLMLRLVLGNQVMVGTINSAREHFQMAVDDLSQATATWGDHVAHVITHRHAYTDFAAALGQHSAVEIKCIIDWAAG